MSLHTQLLRGLFALPVLLLLAVASVTAPNPPSPTRAHAPQARAIVIVEDGRVAILAHAGDE